MVFGCRCTVPNEQVLGRGVYSLKWLNDASVSFLLSALIHATILRSEFVIDPPSIVILSVSESGPLVPVVAPYYSSSCLVPSVSDAHGRGTHSPWTSVPSPTLRGGACNQVTCLDLWVPRFPTNPLSPLAYIRFSILPLLPPPAQERNADTFYRQTPAVKTNNGTQACLSPGAKSPLTPLLHRRHHRLHRLTAATKTVET